MLLSSLSFLEEASVSNLFPQKLDLVADDSIQLPFGSWDILVPELVAG